MASFISSTVKVLVVSVTSHPFLSHSISNYPQEICQILKEARERRQVAPLLRAGRAPAPKVISALNTPSAEVPLAKVAPLKLRKVS